MSEQLKRWLPLGLCCLPGVVVAVIAGTGALLGVASFGAGLGSPLGIGILALAALACPLSMGFMLWRSQRQAPPRASSSMATCCMLGDPASAIEDDRLTILCTQREALERQVAELQSQMDKAAL